ncbi:UNVERIFIED_CONTAM: hypothetical protein GTU68_016421, partial [Idotea baltica]|nr:hypothetical protein [Idotea baltica]
ENRERCTRKLKELPSLRSTGKGAHKFSAVLVPLCHVEGELSLLYTLRTSDLRSHRREVSFPGGKADPSDESLIHTALRETEEEIGVGSERVDVWGTLPPQMGKGGKSSIVGVLGYVGHVDSESFRLNPREVESIFAVALKNLSHPHNCRQTQFRSDVFKSGYTLPIFIGSEPKIWGLTAVITHLTLSALLPGIYKHRLSHITI